MDNISHHQQQQRQDNKQETQIDSKWENVTKQTGKPKGLWPFGR